MRSRTSILLCYILWSVLAGCTGPSPASELPANRTTQPRKLYLTKCAKCHKLYDPAKYSDEQWHKWMVKMSKKSKLTSEQSEMLSRYIDSALRSPPKPQEQAAPR